MSLFVRYLLIAALMIISFVPQATHAQSVNPLPSPGVEEKSGNMFFPIAPNSWQARPVKQKVNPIPALAHGPGQVSAAGTSLCFKWLTQAMLAAGINDYCVGGDQYPGFSVDGTFVSGVESEGTMFGGITETTSQNLTLRGEVLNLNGQKDKSPTVFGTSQKLATFQIDFFGKEDIAAAQSDGLPSMSPEDFELFRAIRGLPWELSKGIPLPIDENFPIFNSAMRSLPATLKMRCHEYLEGEDWWWWHTLFNDVVIKGEEVYLGGLWKTNTDPMFLGLLPTCMGEYRYLSWNSLRTDPAFAQWRAQVLATFRVYDTMRQYTTYPVPQWSDDLGGGWYITYMSAAGGVLMVMYYMVGNTITAAMGMFVIEDDYLKCVATSTDPNSVQTCYVGGEPAITAADWVPK